MNRTAIFAAALLLAGRGSQEAFGLGGDHPPHRLEHQGATCVHGYFINESDVFFHTGDAADFNEFTADLVKTQGRTVRIVVHAGPGKAHSPWDKADRSLPVDWSVTTGPISRGPVEKPGSQPVRIDLWLQGRVKLEDVQYPAEAEIVAPSRLGRPRARSGE